MKNFGTASTLVWTDEKKEKKMSKNIIDYDSTSRGAKNYIKLAHELINKNE